MFPAPEKDRQHHAVPDLLQAQARILQRLQQLIVQAGRRVFRRAPGTPDALPQSDPGRRGGPQISGEHTHLQLSGVRKHRHGAGHAPKEHILIGAFCLESSGFQILSLPLFSKGKHGGEIAASADIDGSVRLGCHTVLHRNMNFRHILSPFLLWAEPPGMQQFLPMQFI